MSESSQRRDTIAARRAAGATQERAQRRQRIVDAAVRAIEEHGSDTGLALVADAADLPRPHVYRHFTSKEDLDREVARHAARMLGAWMRPALNAPGTPPDVVHGVVRRVLQWAVEHPNLYRFRVRLGPEHAIPEITEGTVGYLRAAGYDTRLPEQVVASVIGMVDASVLWWFDHRDELDLETLNERLAGQVWLVFADTLEWMGRPLDPEASLTPLTRKPRGRH